MKELRSHTMQHLMRRGLRMARKKRAPSEGYMHPLINETRKTGWHYQVEYIYDLRLDEKPFVVAYGWKPPVPPGAVSATHFLKAYP